MESDSGAFNWYLSGGAVYVAGWRSSLLDVKDKVGGLLMGIDRQCGLFERVQRKEAAISSSHIYRHGDGGQCHKQELRGGYMICSRGHETSKLSIARTMVCPQLGLNPVVMLATYPAVRG